MAKPPLPDDLNVTVCDACLTAACWQGAFYCESYRSAGTVEKPVGTLRQLQFESPHYWELDPAAMEWRATQGVK